MSSASDNNGNKSSKQLKYIDAGANLLDSMYQGTYHSKPRHDPDLDIVLERAYNKGVHTVISLAGTIQESEELMDLLQGLDDEKNKLEKVSKYQKMQERSMSPSFESVGQTTIRLYVFSCKFELPLQFVHKLGP